MEPLTTAALVMGGAKLIGGIGAGVSDIIATAPNEALQNRIAELERLQQADALGLTGTERAAFVDAFRQPQQALAQQQMEQSQGLQAAMQDSGRQMARLRAQEEQQQRALAAANQQVEVLNLQQQRAQEQELLNLQAAEAQREMARRAAIVKTSTAGLAAAGEMAGQVMATNELINADPGSFDANQLRSLGSMYGYNFPAYSMPAQGYGQPGAFYYGQQPYYAPQAGAFAPFYGMPPSAGLQPAQAAPQQGTGEEEE
jgi:hypothetical protein